MCLWTPEAKFNPGQTMHEGNTQVLAQAGVFGFKASQITRRAQHVMVATYRLSPTLPDRSVPLPLPAPEAP